MAYEWVDKLLSSKGGSSSKSSYSPARQPTPVPTPAPPQRQSSGPSIGTKILNFGKDLVGNVFKSPLAQKTSFAGELGKFAQKFPDTTLRLPKSPLERFTDPTGYQRKIREFSTGMIGDTVRETGKAFEITGTEQGRKDFIRGVNKYPSQIQNRQYGDLLNNPATIAAFGLSNIIPGGTGAKKIVKEGVENLAERGVREVVEQGAKNIPTSKLDDVKLLGPGDPEQRAIDAIQQAKPLRAEQEAIYTAERGRRIAKAVEAGQNAGGGQEGYYAKLRQMQGEMPKVEFETLRKQVSQSDIDALFNKVDQSPALSDFEKLPAQKALIKLFGADGGSVPTEGELRLLREVFKPEFVDAVLSKRPLMQKLFTGATDVLAVPRSLMSSGDFSAPLRQGVFTAVAHPKDFSRSFKNMFKYAFSEKEFNNFYKELKQRPTYQKMREGGLAITEMGTHSVREEAFMSNLAERIPILGRLVRSSDRAYTGFLNNLRADLFDNLYKNGVALGKGDNDKYLKSLTNFINTATGRGDLRNVPVIGEQLAQAAPLLNAGFFSPRLIASRINLMNPKYYMDLEPTVRKEAIKSLVTFAGTGMTILGLAKLAGAEVSTDIRSSDFGKIKIGNTRYDVWGGFQSYAVFFGRMYLNEMVSSNTGKLTKFGEGYKPTTRLSVTGKFLQGKTSPPLSYILEFLQGHNFEYEPFDPVEGVTDRLVPMLWEDIYEAIQDYGPNGLLLSMPGFFGVGFSNYDTGPSSKRVNNSPPPAPSAPSQPSEQKVGTYSL